jgi:hypothetical protein
VLEDFEQDIEMPIVHPVIAKSSLLNEQKYFVQDMEMPSEHPFINKMVILN